MVALNVTCELNNVLLEYFLKAKESILQKTAGIVEYQVKFYK